MTTSTSEIAKDLVAILGKSGFLKEGIEETKIVAVLEQQLAAIQDEIHEDLNVAAHTKDAVPASSGRPGSREWSDRVFELTRTRRGPRSSRYAGNC